MRERVTTGIMSRDDLDLAINWAAAEGWNPGLADATAFHAADPEGFFVARVDEKPVATLSVVRYPDRFAFLGFYIVAEGWRGRGIGWRLWQDALAAREGYTIGLDGVVAQQANYAKSGFQLAHRNIRYCGLAPDAPWPDGAGLVDLRTVPFDRLLTYDKAGFGTARPAFLACWAGLPKSRGLAAIVDGTLRGYGVIRQCREGFKVGPLFADSAGIAEALFVGLTRTMVGPIFVDPPETNRAAVQLAERFGFAPVFETARMYAGPAPATDWTKVYGVTTFELG